MSTDPITQLAAKHARANVHKLDEDFGEPDLEVIIAAALREQREQLDWELIGLRKRIHFLEKHNQWFERCESAWCNPDDKDNPALGITQFGEIGQQGERIAAGAATAEPTSVAPLHEAYNLGFGHGVSRGRAIEADQAKYPTPGPREGEK